jgi:two-component system, OmpR family, sensor histidine kinase VicK
LHLTPSSTTSADKTEVLYGMENAVRAAQFMQNVRERMDLFGDKNGPSIIMEFDVYKNNYLEVKKRGGKIRFITEITRENIQYCKELMKIVDEFRHLDGLVGGIAVSEKEFMGTTSLQEKRLLTHVIYSNVKQVIEQGQYIFNTFWNKAIPARQRIREIEEGVKREFIETIQDPANIEKLVFKLMDSAAHEILAIFPTVKTFERYQHEGIIEFLNKAATNEMYPLEFSQLTFMNRKERIKR